MLRITDLNQLVIFKQMVALIAVQAKYSTHERDRVHLILGELLEEFEHALVDDTPLARYAAQHGYRPIDLDLLSSILTSRTWAFSFEEYLQYGLYPTRFDRLDLIREIKDSPVIRTPISELDLGCERGGSMRFALRVPDYDETSFVSEVVIFAHILAAEGWTVDAQKRIRFLSERFTDRLREGYRGSWEFEEALLIAIAKANETRYLIGSYDDRYLREYVSEGVFESLAERGVIAQDLEVDLRLTHPVNLFG